jgi:hypothetical protein
VIGIVLLSAAAGCGGYAGKHSADAKGSLDASAKTSSIPPQPLLTWVDQPASQGLLQALDVDGVSMGWASCFDAEGTMLSDAACKEERYEGGDVDNPTGIRVLAKLPLPDGAAYFMTFLDDRSKPCYDIAVVNNGSAGRNLHCSRLTDCNALCIFVYEGNGDEQVVGGPVPEGLSSIQVLQLDGESHEYRLTDPTRFHGRRLFVATYTGSPLFLTLEGFDSTHDLVAKCVNLVVCTKD